MVSETVQNNSLSPPWCLNEDDYHQRAWKGSISGTFSVNEHFCAALTDLYPEGATTTWNGGGVGITVDVYGVGTLDTLTIHSDGMPFVYGRSNGFPAVHTSGVLVGTEVVGKGSKTQTWRRWAACVYPQGQNFPTTRSKDRGRSRSPGGSPTSP